MSGNASSSIWQNFAVVRKALVRQSGEKNKFSSWRYDLKRRRYNGSHIEVKTVSMACSTILSLVSILTKIETATLR